MGVFVYVCVLPEGDSVGVDVAAFAEQVGPISGYPHQHVFSLDTRKTGVEPPKHNMTQSTHTSVCMRTYVCMKACMYEDACVCL
jgi:hypothetical protein